MPQHPKADKAIPLMKIYQPKIRLDPGSALAFNVFDWRGEKGEPIVIQKLAAERAYIRAMGFRIIYGFQESMKRKRLEILRRAYVNQREVQGAKGR